MTGSRVAVVYYSATGNMHRLAAAFAEGAGKAGGDVRLRRVAELASTAPRRCGWPGSWPASR